MQSRNNTGNVSGSNHNNRSNTQTMCYLGCSKGEGDKQTQVWTGVMGIDTEGPYKVNLEHMIKSFIFTTIKIKK